MPTYDYECTVCGYTFELFQRFSDRHLEKCPKCNKKLRRLIGSGAGIIFKGSGFYATDYRRGSKKDPTKAQEPACPKLKEGCNACQPPK